MAQIIPRLYMRDIRRRFGPTIALDGVDLCANAGEIHALVGANGAGKSTLAGILSGALRPDSGHMALDGAPFAPANPLNARRSGVAMIYQELALAPHLSVAQNIALGREPTRRGLLQKAAMRQSAIRALTELEHPDIDPDARVGTLSIAARQIVEIARALTCDCRVLLLDEPTSSLSRADAQRLFRVLRRLKDRGIAMVYISHFLEEILQIADRFTVLRDGKVAGSGPVANAAIDDIVRLMVGRAIGDLFPRSRRTPGPPLLSLARLQGNPLPKNASLTLHRGEVLGIAGLVGAGRTELLRTLFGLAPIRSGHIAFAAHTGPASPVQRLAQGMGLLSEDRKTEGLAQLMSTADNLLLSRLPAGLLFLSKRRAAARPWIDRLRIRPANAALPVAALSGGNQQKIALARLLHHGAHVLLLDEPTRGIDIASKADIYRLIDDLAAQGKAVLLASSYPPELLGVCDRIAVMCRGRLGPARPARDWDEHSLMREATGAETSA